MKGYVLALPRLALVYVSLWGKIDAKKALALTTKMTRGKANVTKGVSF